MLELIASSVIFPGPPNVNVAGMNALPDDDIDFTRVQAVETVTVEELALAG